MNPARPEDRWCRAPRGFLHVWAFGLVLLTSPAALAAPPAGTPIDNTAFAAARDSVTGSPVVESSNTVTAVVQALEGVSLWPDRRAAAAAGASVTFQHRLLNRGNAGGNFLLEAIDLGGDAFDFGVFSLVHDVNRDGVAGAGDVPVPNAGLLAMAAGDSADLLVTVQVPAGAPGPGVGRFSLRATSLVQSVTASVNDSVDIGPPPAGVVLFAEKSASRSVVEWGDDFEYRVKVANRSDSALAAVALDDWLPPGFQYLLGTARLAGAPLADPAGAPGPALQHALGPLAPRSELQLTYRVRVGPGAVSGDARSEAVAHAGSTASNTALAVVSVQGDVFTDAAMVMGTVFFDANHDGRPSAGEPGLAGVRLYLDDGSFAITDEQGRYSLPGITPRSHALKVDPTTLPPSAVIAPGDHRATGLPGVRFVDLTRGDLVRADFAAVGDTSIMRDAGDRRGTVARHGADERLRLLARGAEPLAGDRAQPDPRTLPSSRILTGENELPVVMTSAHDPGPPAVSPAVFDAAALDRLLPELQPELGFVGLADLDTVLYTQMPIVVKGAHGTRLVLRVNGAVLPESRVGRRLSAPRQGLEVWEYVGVALRPGINVLEVSPPRSVGRVALRLVAPGPFARLELSAPRGVPADGHSSASLLLRAVDVAGVPVGEHTLVTIDASPGRLAATDLDPMTPGMQLAVKGGALRVPLVAPGTPGTVRVTASAGGVRAAASVEFVPDLRPLIAVGSLEGVVALRRFGAPHPPQGARQASFEAPMEQFATQSVDGEAAAAAHGALFLKGRVRESLLLTVGWDSDRPRDLRQFRDIQPERGFPVVGDASVRGWEAQSTEQLYVRLEQRDASMLYGDFATGGSGARTLGNYSRSLTGATARWANGSSWLAGYTSKDRSERAVDELRGEGTSGPYQLTRLPMVVNSERVEIIVRDRAQPAIVRSTSTRQRFTDYEIEPLTGRVLMRAPVPSLDADLNPVYVRVTYEVEGGAAAAWVHGAEGRVRVSPRVDVGGVYVDDHDPAAPYELRAASASARLGATAVLETEWASTRHVGGAVGDAGRFEVRHENERMHARLWGAATSNGFDNPSASMTGGRNEAGGRLNARIAPRTRLNAEALFSADANADETREGVMMSVDRAIDDSWRGELGLRWARTLRGEAATEPASAAIRGKLSAQVPNHPEWNGYGELEQDTRDMDRRMAALGGEYRFTSRGRLYARHELISSFSSAWALSNTQRQAATVFGVDADMAKDAHVFSEYRLDDAFGGREAQAAVGLRNGWRLSNGIRAGTSFERVTPLSGDDKGPTTAITGSVDWTEDPVWKGSSRAEVRTNRTSDQFLQSMAAAVKLDSAWTGLGRQLLTLERRHGQGGDARERLQLAAAYRPGGAWDAICRWELRYDREAPEDGPRTRHIANIGGLAATGRASGFEASLGWAGKVTREEASEMITAGGAQWWHGRLTRDLGPAWDCGVTASVLAGRRFAQRQYGLGAEAGRLLPGGLWLSLGYNGFGYADDELTGEQWTRAGAYLRMRVKLDETLFQRSEVRR